MELAKPLESLYRTSTPPIDTTNSVFAVYSIKFDPQNNTTNSIFAVYSIKFYSYNDTTNSVFAICSIIIETSTLGHSMKKNVNPFIGRQEELKNFKTIFE